MFEHRKCAGCYYLSYMCFSESSDGHAVHSSWILWNTYVNEITVLLPL